ncbi:MAG TPA: chemotaxis protein CheA [Gammaproteobacteria bacterium]
MSIDIRQFHQVFFEESLEGLERMEAALLDLSRGSGDGELIHAIFRAAHSIKGGSGTFGFQAIAAFTHVMETLLDEMRDGSRAITADALNVLLESVDVLKELLVVAQQGRDHDHARVAAMQARLEALLDRGGAAAMPTAAASTTHAETSEAIGAGWRIGFKPHTHLMQTGNDPVRMFRELAELGRLESVADLSALPAFAGLDPEECHLAWTLILHSVCDRAQVEEIFSWVDGGCELSIAPLAAAETARPDETAQALPAGDAATAKAAAAPGRPANAETSSIRVGIDKIDSLINIVGELVITQSMLGEVGSGSFEELTAAGFERLRDGLAELERSTRELQEAVMRIRMLPIGFAFNRFPRLVHDLSTKLGKQIELRISGEQTELDKTVMEKISDPLVHLVRNSLDHGIETPEQRRAAGKPATGVLHLNAYHQGGNIVIEISDDGAGLNRERILAKARANGLVRPEQALTDAEVDDLIFAPGFSTAEVVSDVSGRGVGMDVVRRNIHELGGSVEVRSETGRGAVFTIRLPLTLAILDGQLVRVGAQVYIVPLVSIVESLQIDSAALGSIAGNAQVYRLREQYLPIIDVRTVFNVDATQSGAATVAGGLLMVVEAGGSRVGLVVDDLLNQQQVVIKSLESNFKRIEGLAGATILGDGTVALILDVSGLIDVARRHPQAGRLRVVADNAHAA